MEKKPSIGPNESEYIGQVLTATAESMSAGLSKFSGWMLVGFAAILGILLINIESTEKFLPPGALSRIVMLFSMAVLLNLLHRFAAAVVSSSAEIAKKMRDQPVPENINVALILSQLEYAALWPARLLVRRANQNILSGDLAAAGRLLSTLAQIEAWLVFTQALISVAAIFVLAFNLQG